VEAGSSGCLHKYKTREDDIILGIDRFGQSGSPAELAEEFGFAVSKIRALLEDMVG
jgi:transketolase